MKNRFSIVAAYTKSNRGIGFQNRLPWSIKEDMDWFKRITTQKYPDARDGNAVIMGRKTWDSLPEKYKPLPNRHNFVLSRGFAGSSPDDWINELYAEHDDTKYPNTTWINHIESVTERLLISQRFNQFKYFLIGGQSIFEQAIKLPECEMLYITEIDDDVCKTPDGNKIVCDTFFPEIPINFIQTDEIKGKTPGVTFKMYKSLHNPESSEFQYIDMLKRISKEGELTTGRNGNVLSIFGEFQHKFDLREGFPLLTTKRMPFNVIMKELIFFIRGETDSRILAKDGVHIWDGNTTKQFLKERGLSGYTPGDMGPMYGWNWRHFGARYQGCEAVYKDQGFDQLHQLIDNIMNDPSSRRLLLTTYDPSKVEESVLAPCHGLTVQFNVSQNRYLDCKMYQRSVDTALGYPFNIASYAAFTHIVARATGLEPRFLFTTLGDTHIYESHIKKIKRHFDRLPMVYPTLELNSAPEGDTVKDKLTWMESLKSSDFNLKDYHHYPGIKMDMIA